MPEVRTRAQLSNHVEQMEASRRDFRVAFQKEFPRMMRLNIDPKKDDIQIVAWLFFMRGQKSVKR